MKEKMNAEYSYVCPKCDYKAVRMGKLTECPLCKICTGCGKPVGHCTCVEGE